MLPRQTTAGRAAGRCCQDRQQLAERRGGVARCGNAPRPRRSTRSPGVLPVQATGRLRRASAPDGSGERPRRTGQEIVCSEQSVVQDGVLAWQPSKWSRKLLGTLLPLQPESTRSSAPERARTTRRGRSQVWREPLSWWWADRPEGQARLRAGSDEVCGMPSMGASVYRSGNSRGGAGVGRRARGVEQRREQRALRTGPPLVRPEADRERLARRSHGDEGVELVEHLEHDVLGEPTRELRLT